MKKLLLGLLLILPFAIYSNSLDPMVDNYRQDSKMIQLTAEKNGLLKQDDIQNSRCLKKLTCIKLRIYINEKMSADVYRKINNAMSEIYYNYYNKYGSNVFFISITVRYVQNYDYNKRQPVPGKKVKVDNVYITVLSFARYNQVPVYSAEDAKGKIPLLWHTEFVHPQFRVN